MNDVDRSMPPAEVGRLARAVLDAVGTVVVGKRDALELVLAGILAGGHVLLEDLPGPGQDADRAVASPRRSGSDFRRLQFTPDLLPADVTGSFLYDQRSDDFTFRAGPIFTNLLLADEINRTPPKTQSALLEAMQEKQVSVEGVTYRLDAAVPRARHRQPDRVRGHLPAARGAARPVPAAGLVRLPEPRRGVGRAAPADGPPPARRRSSSRWSTPATLRAMQAALEDVVVEDSIGRYIVALTAATREHPSVLVGASPRGSLALLLLSRVRAVLRRPGLRGARGRQGGGGARPGAPDHAAAGDVAAPGRPGLRGRRGAGSRRPAPASGALPSYAAGRGRRDGLRRPLTSTRPRRRAGAAADGGGRLGADPGARPGRAAHRAAAARRGAARPGRPGRAGRPVRARHRLGAASPARGRRRCCEHRRRRTPRWSRAATLAATVAVGNPDPVDYDLVVVRTPVSPWLRIHRAGCAGTGRSRRRRADRPFARRCRPAPASTWSCRRRRCAGAATSSARPAPGRSPATGCWSARPVRHRAACGSGSTRRPSRSRPTRRCPGPPGWSAGTGPGGPGEGGELAGVRRFGPGDRLRRIDWRVSLRARQLHVAAHPLRPGRRGRGAARRAARGGPLRRRRRRGVGAGHHGAGRGRDRRALPAPGRPGRAAGVRPGRPAGCARPAAAGST